MGEDLFIPSYEWTLADPTDLPIRYARREMNQENPKELLEKLRKEIKHTEGGVNFAVLRGDNPEEYSSTDALVIFNQFGISPNDSSLVRAEFVRRVAREADVHDDEGKLKPVILLGSPSHDYGSAFGRGLKLTKNEKEVVKNGQLGPYAERLLNVVAWEGFGRVALRGLGQGADVALAAGEKQYRYMLDLDSISVGAVIAQEDRDCLALLGSSTKARTKSLRRSIKNTGLIAQKETQDNLVGVGVLGASALINTNRVLLGGLSKNSFEERIQTVLDQGEIDKIILGYGTNDAYSNTQIIESAIQGINDMRPESVVSVRINNGDHAWGEQLTILSKLYLLAA
jgi:hypothetical protein